MYVKGCFPSTESQDWRNGAHDDRFNGRRGGTVQEYAQQAANSFPGKIYSTAMIRTVYEVGEKNNIP